MAMRDANFLERVAVLFVSQRPVEPGSVLSSVEGDFSQTNVPQVLLQPPDELGTDTAPTVPLVNSLPRQIKSLVRDLRRLGGHHLKQATGPTPVGMEQDASNHIAVHSGNKMDRVLFERKLLGLAFSRMLATQWFPQPLKSQRSLLRAADVHPLNNVVI